MATCIRDTKKFNALIGAVLKAGASFQSQLQDALVSACFHLVEHDNLTPINRLVTETATLCHENTVALWLAQYGPVKWSKKDKSFKADKKRIASAKENLETYINDLENAPAYHSMAKPKTPFKGFDLLARINSLVDTAEDMAAGVTKDGEDLTEEEKAKVHVDPAMLAKLRAIAIGAPSAAVH